MNANPSYDKSWRCWGRYEISLEETRGVLLPERFRAALGGKVALVCLPCHAVRVFQRAVWEKGTAALARMDMEAANQIRAQFHAPPTLAAFDGEGYLFLPPFLCEWAAISAAASLIVLGMGQSVEIWSRDVWEKFDQSAQEIKQP